jgi:hypothetical protein
MSDNYYQTKGFTHQFTAGEHYSVYVRQYHEVTMDEIIDYRMIDGEYLVVLSVLSSKSEDITFKLGVNDDGGWKTYPTSTGLEKPMIETIGIIIELNYGILDLGDY